jgi:hypothetical protein
MTWAFPRRFLPLPCHVSAVTCFASWHLPDIKTLENAVDAQLYVQHESQQGTNVFLQNARTSSRMDFTLYTVPVC